MEPFQRNGPSIDCVYLKQKIDGHNVMDRALTNLHLFASRWFFEDVVVEQSSSRTPSEGAYFKKAVLPGCNINLLAEPRNTHTISFAVKYCQLPPSLLSPSAARRGGFVVVVGSI